MPAESLTGAGNCPAATLRHSVVPEKGSGAGVFGRFRLCTSCDSRMNAPSGIRSNDGIGDVAAVGWGVCAVGGAAFGFCFALGLYDIECPSVSEGAPSIAFSGLVNTYLHYLHRWLTSVVKINHTTRYFRLF